MIATGLAGLAAYLLHRRHKKKREERLKNLDISEYLDDEDDFDYSDDLINDFYNMQDKYLLNKKYKISIEDVKDSLTTILKYFI